MKEIEDILKEYYDANILGADIIREDDIMEEYYDDDDDIDEESSKKSNKTFYFRYDAGLGKILRHNKEMNKTKRKEMSKVGKKNLKKSKAKRNQSIKKFWASSLAKKLKMRLKKK